jgi:hypothetical protein
VHQAEQIAIGTHVVETVVVHAHVADVRGHVGHGALAPQLQVACLAGGVELQDRRAELKALRPLGPTARRVLPGNGKDGRALRRVPGVFDPVDLVPRQREKAVDLGQERARFECGVDLDHASLLILRGPRRHMAYVTYLDPSIGHRRA